MRTLNKVIELIECTLNECLFFTLVHCSQKQCKVTEILGRQITLTCRIINLVLFFPTLNSQTNVLIRLGVHEVCTLRQGIVSSYRVLYLHNHAFRLRTIIISECSCENSLLSLCRHSIEHLFKSCATSLKYALIHNTSQIILCLCCNVAFCVESTLVLSWCNVSFLSQPIQHINAVFIYKSCE